MHRCLAHKPRAWEDFADRFLGLVVHVINHSAQCRSIRLSAQDREDLASEVFLAIVDDDYGVLRRFRGQSSLATYLTVVARRVVVRELMKRPMTSKLGEHPEIGEKVRAERADGQPTAEARISDRDEVEALLGELHGEEADVVRMYHLEGKTYRQISSDTGMPENSVGPTLSRARAKMRGAGADSPLS